MAAFAEPMVRIRLPPPASPPHGCLSVAARSAPASTLLQFKVRQYPTMAVSSGEELAVAVRGAFDDVKDISAAPTPFTPACYGHLLALPCQGSKAQVGKARMIVGPRP